MPIGTSEKREKWLVLDDNDIDRRRTITAVSQIDPTIEAIGVESGHAALEKLKSGDFSVCVLDFYLRGKATCRHVHNEIRAAYPEIVTLIASGLADRKSEVHQLGADGVVPKLMSIKDFSMALRTSYLSGRKRHQTRISSTGNLTPYLSAVTRKVIGSALHRNKGNLLIVSPPGMGRTSLARVLARRLRDRNQATHGEEVRILSLAEHVSEPVEALDELIFGTMPGSEGQPGTKGVLEDSRESILIVDDLHLLPQALQQKLKTVFERQWFASSLDGKSLRTSRLRIVFTCDATQEGRLIQGLTAPLVDSRITLQCLRSMTSDLPDVIDFWMEREFRKRKQLRFKSDRDFKSALLQAVNKHIDRVSMRSLARTIESAVELATAQQRNFVTKYDLGSLDFLYEARVSSSRDDGSTMVEIPAHLPADAIRQLVEGLTERSYDETCDLVFRILFETHSELNSGNLKRTAVAMGISEKTFYKPSFEKRGLKRPVRSSVTYAVHERLGFDFPIASLLGRRNLIKTNSKEEMQ
jgi:DNA-binding NtrC family response regulator